MWTRAALVVVFWKLTRYLDLLPRNITYLLAKSSLGKIFKNYLSFHGCWYGRYNARYNGSNSTEIGISIETYIQN
jgi:hypothetical protein